MRTASIRRLGLGAVVALALVGCQTTLSLNTENLQNIIKTGIEEQNVANAVTVSSVTCPERPLQQGDTFDCTAVTSAGSYRVSVIQTDGAGNVSWEIAGPL